MADKYNLGTVGSGIVVTELWSGLVGNLASSVVDKITLNDNITNYKFLIFDFCCSYNGGSGKRYYSRVVSVQQFTNLFNDAGADSHISFTWGYGTITDFFDIHQDSTTKVLNYSCNFTQCTRILGIN